MLFLRDNKISFICQGFEATTLGISDDGTQTVLMMRNKSITSDVFCKKCNGRVNIYDNFDISLKDIPIISGMESIIHCSAYRYRCMECGKTFSEEIPFKQPGTRITRRAADWIKGFLVNKVSIKSIQNLTGIHWYTINWYIYAWLNFYIFKFTPLYRFNPMKSKTENKIFCFTIRRKIFYKKNFFIH